MSCLFPEVKRAHFSSCYVMLCYPKGKSVLTDWIPLESCLVFLSELTTHCKPYFWRVGWKVLIFFYIKIHIPPVALSLTLLLAILPIAIRRLQCYFNRTKNNTDARQHCQNHPAFSLEINVKATPVTEFEFQLPWPCSISSSRKVLKSVFYHPFKRR